MFTEEDRQAWDLMWAAAEMKNPDGVDQLVRKECARLEGQFVYDHETETGEAG